MPGLSIDEEFDEDEDVRMEVQGVAFFAEKDFIERHGTNYEVTIDPQKGPVLTPKA